MMDYCQCQGIENKFDQGYVTKKLEKYRAAGPKKTTLQLIEALQSEELQGMTLLDIGGGVGDIQHALLDSGISSAINVEASTAYLEACKAEAKRKGHGDRIKHIQGNFTDLAEDVLSADIVTLDRVICCYHDMPQLVSLSAQKATRFYGVVYPRDTWWTRLGNEVYYNLRHWMQGISMRNFIHPTEEVEAVLLQNSLEKIFYCEMGPWQVVLFSRI